MNAPSTRFRFARRVIVRAFSGFVASALLPAARGQSAGESDPSAIDDDALIRRLLGRSAVVSVRMHLLMPAAFGNGYSVPMSFSVDSQMTEDEHVRAVHVLAPLNPIIVVAKYEFSPRSGRAAIMTRIRLARTQGVLAVAEMSDGELLMARTQVGVETDGCS